MEMSTAFLSPRRERFAAGVAARRHLPRGDHAAWSPPADRRNPVDILVAQGRTRIQELLPTRYERMRASAFAFLRGSAAVMAADLAGRPHTGLTTQLCGDAHVANFGSFGSPEGHPLFDVNDFDETLPGPFEWDVQRMAASFAVCGRDAGLEKAARKALAARSVRAYRKHMARLAQLSPFDVWHSRIDLAAAIDAVDDRTVRRGIKKRLQAAVRAHDAQYSLVERTDEGPRIRDHGTTEHIDRFRPDIEAVFDAYRLSAPAHLDALFRHYRLADTAFKVVGVGSVGTFCALGLFVSADGAPLLLQAKEAQISVLQAGLPPSVFTHQGERVVAGQRVMQAETDIFLGWPPAQIDGRWFYVRRLKDSRLANVGSVLETEALDFAASLCGRTLARAHARGGDAATLAGYIGQGASFDDAVADFAMAYAEQTVRDWQDFCAALENGRLGIS
jgi:uncharacterized protein (DUF2252 family)